MNLLLIPELFFLTTTNLSDKEKISIVSCSKIIYNYKSLLRFNREYNLEKIYNNWRMLCVKNIIINEFHELYEEIIKELLGNLITQSIVANYPYVNFCSLNANIKLFYNRKIIRIIISYGYHYLAMKMMLNNNEYIININYQFVNASRYGYLEVVKLLIEKGANVRAQNNQGIIVASEYGYLEIVKLLIKNNVDMRAQNNRSIISASFNGHLSIVELLIKNGANVCAQNNQAIINASGKGHLKIVKLLIDSGANVSDQHNQAIINSSKGGYLEITKLLIDSGANVCDQNNLAIRFAGEKDHLKIVKLLIDSGANVSAQNDLIIRPLDQRIIRMYFR